MIQIKKLDIFQKNLQKSKRSQIKYLILSKDQAIIIQCANHHFNQSKIYNNNNNNNHQ